MMIPANSLARQKLGVQGGGGRGGRPKKGRSNRNSDARADAPTGLSQSRVLDVRSMRKHGRWYGVLLHRKSRWGYGLIVSSHDRNGGSYKSMNGVGKE